MKLKFVSKYMYTVAFIILDLAIVLNKSLSMYKYVISLNLCEYFLWKITTNKHAIPSIRDIVTVLSAHGE